MLTFYPRLERFKAVKFFFLIVFILITALFFPKAVFAKECDPDSAKWRSDNPEAAKSSCKKEAPCKIDCIEVPGETNSVCCPKGCIGKPCAEGQICFENPLNSCTFNDLIESVMSFILTVGIAISVLMTVIAGYYFLTSSGDQKRIKTAKDIILYTIIGLCIILLAKGLVSTIKYIVGVE
jgi:hypothetical protein